MNTVVELPNSLPIGTRLAEFEIREVIGEGGFGIVYLAFDHSLQRTVAIKEYMPSALASRSSDHTVSVRSKRHAEAFGAGLRSFINEARLLAQFDHPALVKVYRFWELHGTAYMAMRYYEGRTFKAVVRDNPELVNEAWLKRLLQPVLGALEALYAAKILHRDVSPENIMIQPDGQPVLLDFGAARQIVQDMAQSLTVILKPGFAPVEQYADDESMRQGPWTDIYSLSAVMYAAVTGKAPPAAVARMLNDPIEPLAVSGWPGYGAQFLEAIDRGMAVRPEIRPQSIAEFAALLGLEGASPAAAPTSAPGGAARSVAAAGSGSASSGATHAGGVAAAAGHTVPAADANAAASPVAANAGGAAPGRAMHATPAGTGADAPPAAARGDAKAGGAALPAAGGTRSTTTSRDDNSGTGSASRAARNGSANADASKSDPGKRSSRSKTATSAAGKSATQGGKQATPAGPARRPSHTLVGAGVAALVMVIAGIAWFSSGSPVAPAASETAPGAAQAARLAADGAAPSAATLAPAVPAAAASVPATAAANSVPAAPNAAASAAASAASSGEAAAPSSGTLAIAVQPWATIYVDGVEKGITPPLKKLTLPPGEHEVRLENPNFPAHVQKVTVDGRKPVTIKHDFGK